LTFWNRDASYFLIAQPPLNERADDDRGDKDDKAIDKKTPG